MYFLFALCHRTILFSVEMKKKRQNIVNAFIPEADLDSRIHQNSLFFDKLIELIPAKFYLPISDKEKKWFQGLSKDE